MEIFISLRNFLHSKFKNWKFSELIGKNVLRFCFLSSTSLLFRHTFWHLNTFRKAELNYILSEVYQSNRGAVRKLALNRKKENKMQIWVIKLGYLSRNSCEDTRERQQSWQHGNQDRILIQNNHFLCSPSIHSVLSSKLNIYFIKDSNWASVWISAPWLNKRSYITLNMCD